MHVRQGFCCTHKTKLRNSTHNFWIRHWIPNFTEIHSVISGKEHSDTHSFLISVNFMYCVHRTRTNWKSWKLLQNQFVLTFILVYRLYRNKRNVAFGWGTGEGRIKILQMFSFQCYWRSSCRYRPVPVGITSPSLRLFQSISFSLQAIIFYQLFFLSGIC
jgi:hypothetical protein